MQLLMIPLLLVLSHARLAEVPPHRTRQGSLDRSAFERNRKSQLKDDRSLRSRSPFPIHPAWDIPDRTDMDAKE
jgi:hypothetical protein